MGRDRHRSPSRSPGRNRKDDSGDEDADYSRRRHKESSRCRNQSEEDRSDDEYERKKEQRKREKESRKREKEERRRERGGEHSQNKGYGSSEYASGEYRSQPGPYAQYQQPAAAPRYDYGGYGQPQFNPEQQPYGGVYQRGPEYGYGQPQYTGYHPPPPGSPPSGYGQQQYNPSPAYNQYAFPPPTGGYGGQVGYTPPPPGSHQGQYPSPAAPPASGPPPSSPCALGYSSRPQYSTEGATSSTYRPQAHSTVQAANEGSMATFFSPVSMPQTSTQGESVLDSFTKGFNEAIHGCARTLFPATSTYSGGEPEARTGNRFESFAPVRNGNGVKWYVDGKDYMYAVSVALEKARESIWILDWWLSPELYLRRPPKLNEQYRLDRMLQAAAARGVHINVIVYKEVTQALTLDSHHTKHALEDLHQNICVFRHPDHLPDRDNVIRNTLTKIQSGNYQLGDGLKGIYGFKNDITLYFAHHEKLCLIDGEIAFMGGLDLCFGRFDTNDHPIADAHPSDLNAIIFPGQDYNNARFMDFQHVDKWQDNVVSRLELPRMGWSDVTMSLMGPGVKDLQKHFVQRWNFIYDEKYDARGVPRYSRLDASAFEGGHGYHRRHLKEKMKRTLRDPGHYGGYYEQQNQDYRSDQEPEGVRVQICRSVSRWSHRPPETEHSIANAYSKIISAADHFVYIENQFFITATDPAQKPILNTIGQAIVNRIIRAHNEAKRFRIIVVMPAVPAFAGDLQSDGALGTRAIMEFQYRSINRDRGYSIYEQLEKAGIDPKEYIRFYNLRSYDRINTAGAEAGKEATGVNYESAARAHDEAVGGGIGYGRQEGAGAYGAPIEGDEYKMYQSNAPKLGSGGQWDSVAKCVMLGGADIRQVPWDGDPDKEIDAFVSEELYVHSKLLIADDRLVLMGSANLNDRSQLGDHDSEIACIIEDPTELRSFMNGSPHIAAHFAATLRRQIFRKHLGLIPAQNFHTEDANMLPVPVPNIYDFDSPEDYLVRDPLSDKFWNFWNETAKVNTEVFSRVFHAVPHDSVTNWRIYEEYWSKYFAAPKGKKEGQGGAEPMIKWGHVVTPNFTPGAAGAREVKELLSAVRGHLVEMPLDFLKEEDIAKEGLGLNALTEILYT